MMDDGLILCGRVVDRAPFVRQLEPRDTSYTKQLLVTVHNLKDLTRGKLHHNCSSKDYHNHDKIKSNPTT